MASSGQRGIIGQKPVGAEGGYHKHGETCCQNCSTPTERFPKYCLVKGDPIGQPGAFGSVIKGFLNADEPTSAGNIVVKMLHAPIGQKRYSVIQDMFNLRHRNLIKFLGIIDNDPLNDCPQLLFRCASEGNLLDYVKNPDCTMDAEELNKFALDIVHGMEYLHSMNFIHGCLSARNVLLHESGIYTNAKISDYGMPRVISGNGANYFSYVGGKSIPIRWLPKECIPIGQNSVEIIKPSDVWSFGVVLWEMWTRGEIPYGSYGSVSNLEVKQHILNGSSPLTFRRPDNCRAMTLNIMENIFVVDPEQRPIFDHLKLLFNPVPPRPSDTARNNNPTNAPSRGGDGARGGRGRSRGRRGGGGRSDNSPSHESGYNHEYRQNDHLDTRSSGDVHAAVNVKREEYRSNRPQRNESARGGTENRHRSDFRENGRRPERGTDPRNSWTSNNRGRAAHTGNNRRGPGLLPTPSRGGSGSRFQHRNAPPLMGSNSPCDGPPPYDSHPDVAPPPYSEAASARNQFAGSKNRHNDVSGDLQQTVQRLQDKIKSLEVRQGKDKRNAEETEKKKQALQEEKWKQAAEEGRRSQLEADEKEENRRRQILEAKKREENERQLMESRKQAEAEKRERDYNLRNQGLLEAEEKEKEEKRRIWRMQMEEADQTVREEKLRKQAEAEKRVKDENLRKQAEAEKRVKEENLRKLKEAQKRERDEYLRKLMAAKEENARQLAEADNIQKSELKAEEEEQVQRLLEAEKRKQRNIRHIEEQKRKQMELRNEMEARRIQDELNAKQAQEERDALHALQLHQQQQRDWETEQEQRKKEAIEANERRKRAILEEEFRQHQLLRNSANASNTPQPQRTEFGQYQTNLFNVGRPGTSTSTASGLANQSNPTTIPPKSYSNCTPVKPPPKEKESCVTM